MKKSDPMQSKLVDRIGLGPEERELKLGTSFTNPRESAFHTLRYDFKPASVDANKMATIDVGTNSQVTVNLPPNFIFRGNAKPYQRQCIAIVNPVTGDVTLEKLTFNIQVKNIRSENQKMTAQKMSMIDQFISGQKPKKPNSVKGTKTHTVTNNTSNNNSNNSNGNNNGNNNNNNSNNSSSYNSNNNINNSNTSNNNNNNNNNNINNNNINNNNNSSSSSSSSNNNNNNNNSGNVISNSSSSQKSSVLKSGKKRKASQPAVGMNSSLPIHSNSARNSPNSLNSIPTPLLQSNTSPSKTIMGDQPALDNWFSSPNSGRSNPVKQDTKKFLVKDEVKPLVRHNDDVGELSDSSSACGSSGSGDSSDSSSDSESQQKKKVSVRQNRHLNNPSADPEVLLKEDLQLSESGSDSD